MSYEYESLEELQRYAQQNRRLAQQLGGAGVADLDVVITFKRALPLADFQAWVKSRPLRVSAYTMRIIGKDGERVTVGGAPDKDVLVAEARLKRILDHLAEKGATDLRGVITVEGTLRTDDYERIAADPDVFLADVSRSFVQHEANRKNPSLKDRPKQVVVRPAFWYLEDLGLVK